MKNFNLLVCAFFIFLFGNAQPYITTSTTQFTHEELVTQVLINSPCAIVENIVGVTGTNFGNLNGIGYFENTNSNFPIDNGVILMTGAVNEAPGPNGGTQGGGGWPGDQQLFNYIQGLGIDPGLTSYNDASILEFDFRPLTDSISFNFVFASNEYGIFQCDFSDAFAFFLTEVGTGEVTNLAIVPDTNDPISVITIRDQLYNSSCGSVNPEFFDVFYGTPNGLPDVQSPINFNGHTVLMQAWSFVTPNTQYRMKLVIADRNDTAFNSAVFLEGGSFFIGNADLGEDLTIQNGNAPCDGDEILLTVETSESSIITWYFNGVILEGETGSTLLVTVAGTYGVEIVNPDAPDCIITDEIIVEFKTSPIVELGEDILVCNEVTALLDATPLNSNDFDAIFYQWFLNDEILVEATEATLLVSEIGVYSVEVTTDLGCVVTDSISVLIPDFSVSLGEDVTPCDSIPYEIVPLIEGIDPSEVTYLWSTGETTPSIFVITSGNYSVVVSYLECTKTDDIQVDFIPSPILDLGDELLECDALFKILDATPENNNIFNELFYQWYFNGTLITGATQATLEITENGIYTVEVTTDLGCTITETVSVTFVQFSVNLGADVFPCDATSFEIVPLVEGINPSDATYLWNTGQTTFSITVTTSGTYSVDVSYFGCTQTDTIEVNFRELPLVNLGTSLLKCAQDILTLNAQPQNESSGQLTFIWFFNGGVILNENASTLDVTEAGIYAVEVNDNGCITSEDVEVNFYANENCIISQGISPNRDGLNDCFDLQFLNDKSSITKLSIFNRYGSIVFEQANYVDQWCGQSDNGELLPIGNYYYVITFQEEKPKTGYIYLNK
ncbi:MAG: hypothetical protein CVU03_00630 [Bacteroidetes bacterium HGW-Bacteroidetes-2]|jgi:gliding motility-associated-like protein|nr:MAG: hypothetical protein CVU03_00630 [Bacteroidetes bacterium HGW-Bacteroidetes-2]